MKWFNFFLLVSLCFTTVGFASETANKSLTLKGVLVQGSGDPVPNIKVYMQKAFLIGNDKSRVRTQFTTNDQGQLSMPLGITDEKGHFSVTFNTTDLHRNFAISLRKGRASLDFPVIYVFKLARNAWEDSSQRTFNIGELSIPKGWEPVHFEKGTY